MSKVRKKLAAIPANPGVYLFKNQKGDILYIGKAKNLSKRVRSYFNKSIKEPKTLRMLSLAADIDYVVVSTETESLMLENNLIKQHRPPYNVLMRDDKNYQFFKIDYESEIPQIYSVRRIDTPSPSPLPPGERVKRKRQDKYFGPYTSGLTVKRTKHLLNRIFHLCQNKKISQKPCFAYHLKRCSGVCIGKTGLREYKKTFKQIENFLKNRQAEVVKNLTREMRRASGEKKFEKAALLRDRLRSLQNIWERQKVVSAKNENSDFIGLYQTPTSAYASLLRVRGGRLLGQRQFELSHAGASQKEILLRLVNQYYAVTSDPPKEIFLPQPLPISRIKNIKILSPVRGKKKQLVGLAERNAELNYGKSLAVFQSKSAVSRELEELKKVLKLKSQPSRIEGFDISNLQGTNPVGSMVVFTRGRPDKAQYRKFKILTKQTPDDAAMMKEIINRRFRHIPTNNPTLPPLNLRGGEEGLSVTGEENRGREKTEHWPRPDLVVVDGGKGQLGAALGQIANSKLQIPAVGLAKRREEIYLPGRKDPLRLSADSPALKILQRIRDEAHRFAVTFHKSRRGKAQVKSKLDEIAGIGPKTKKRLLQRFGSLSKIRAAEIKEIADEVGKAKARKIKEGL